MTGAIYKHCDPGFLMETVDNDVDLFLQLHEIFVREGGEKFAKMIEAASTGHIEQLGRHSHALKGTVGPLGAGNLVGMLQKIEDECLHQRCLCGADRLDQVKNEMDAVRREMDHYILSLKR